MVNACTGGKILASKPVTIKVYNLQQDLSFNMTTSSKAPLNPILFGTVIGLASLLVVTIWFQSDITLSYGIGGSGGGGGSGGLLVCPPVCPDEAKQHLDEAKKSLDAGDTEGAKMHIDKAKQSIGDSTK